MTSLRLPALTAVVVLAIGLAACSSPAGALSTSKTEAQLVRNGAAERLPADAILDASDTGDRPVPCGDGDPHLAWLSSVVIDLADGDTAHFDALIDSLVDDGWVRGRPDDTGIRMVNSTLGASAQLQLKDADTAPAISIEVTGRCVLTAGIGSDEVGRLAGL